MLISGSKEGKKDNNHLQDPETVLRRNLAQIFENPEILPTILNTDGIAKRQKDGTDYILDIGEQILISQKTRMMSLKTMRATNSTSHKGKRKR